MSNTTYRVLVEKLGASNAEQFIGNEGEVFYDPTGSVLRLSDGATPGGIILGGGQSNVWVRPTDWLTMPTVGSTEEKFVGLFAVYDLPENFIALQFEGNYTVDWGDGTVENINGGVKAAHSYTWSDIPSDTLTSEGYRQVIVTVTPQSGEQLTSMNIAVRHDSVGAFSGTSTPWLDIIFSLPNAVTGQSIILSDNGNGEYLADVQRISILNSGNATNFNLLLYYAVALRSFYLGVNLVEDMSSMLQYCTSLTSASLPDTSSAITMNGMFYECRSLTSVSLPDTSSVTDMADMFRECTSLTSVSLPDTSSVTSMYGMFVMCYSLRTVTLLDTSSVTDMADMFRECTSLPSVSLPDTSLVADMAAMFQYCYSLTSVSLPDTSLVTSMNSMFQDCWALTSAPLLNTSSVTDMYSMFYNCYSLNSVPLYGTSLVTSMTFMFSNCGALTSVPLFDVSSLTNLDLIFNNCPSLQIGSLDGTQLSISYASCLLGRDAIVDIFNNLGTVVSQIIDISGNYGTIDLTAGDIGIATSKGWQVTI